MSLERDVHSMPSLMWFDRAEYQSRLNRIQAALRQRGLDGLIAFQPETISWVTGHYTRAYSGYQVAVIPQSGGPVLICRNVSRYYAEQTYAFDDVVYWRDGEDRDALCASVVKERLGETGRFGMELGCWVLNPARLARLTELLQPARLVDVEGMTAKLRLIKSPPEVDFQRRAARAAEAAMDAVLACTRPGANELDIAAEACAALVRNGSDTPGPGVFSSGERALHLHGGYMSRQLELGDTLQYEPTPHMHHYNARFMRTIKVGRCTPQEERIAEDLIAIQDAAIAAVAPGVPAHVPDRIYRDGIRSTGLVKDYTNKTFYSVGLLMHPTDAEPLEATAEADWRFEPGMTFHSYLLVNGFGVSETIHVTDSGVERLTNYRRALLVSAAS